MLVKSLNAIRVQFVSAMQQKMPTCWCSAGSAAREDSAIAIAHSDRHTDNLAQYRARLFKLTNH